MRIHLQSLVFGMFQDLDYCKSVVLSVIHTDSVKYYDQIMQPFDDFFREFGCKRDQKLNKFHRFFVKLLTNIENL